MNRAGPRVVVVGSGWRFTSGISYYTCRLTNALATAVPAHAILMRRLVPSWLYPGRRRIGSPVHDLVYAPQVQVLDGVDWYWGRTIMRARAFLQRMSPDVLVLQWWTGAVLHTYLLLACWARARGAAVVMEWHEVQDTGEARIPGAARYVRALMAPLMRRVDAHIVHSGYDLELLRAAYGLDPAKVTVVPHGPYDHVTGSATNSVSSSVTSGEQPGPAGPAGAGSSPGPDHEPFRLLYFGVIRPYKGVEDLIEAFSSLDQTVRRQFHLTVVGETWEGWHGPLEAARTSPARDRITIINRYVTDAEARQHFALADAVVLPYRRSSSSGPLHIAMSAGLPVVVTSVGGLVEAASGYQGVRFVPPQDPGALAQALRELPALRGRRFADPHSWQASVQAYLRTFERIGLTMPEPGPGAGWRSARVAASPR